MLNRRSLLLSSLACMAVPAAAEAELREKPSFSEGRYIMRMRDQLTRDYGRLGLPVSVTVENYLVHLVVPGQLLFEPGLPRLSQAGLERLAVLGETLKDTPRAMAEVVSIWNRPAEDWEAHVTALRYAQASIAALELQGIDPRRLEAQTFRTSRLYENEMLAASRANRLHVVLHPSLDWLRAHPV